MKNTYKVFCFQPHTVLLIFFQVFKKISITDYTTMAEIKAVGRDTIFKKLLLYVWKHSIIIKTVVPVYNYNQRRCSCGININSFYCSIFMMEDELFSFHF